MAHTNMLGCQVSWISKEWVADGAARKLVESISKATVCGIVVHTEYDGGGRAVGDCTMLIVRYGDGELDEVALTRCRLI